jgi:hypothetical protein
MLEHSALSVAPLVAALLLIGVSATCATAADLSFHAQHVDLSSTADGDRVAFIQDGRTRHLPAKRVDLLPGIGGGGAARYIRRTRNGDLYVTGVGLEGLMLRSTDAGHTWTRSEHKIEGIRFLSAFCILQDDTFLVAFMGHDRHRSYNVARSTDLGKTWQVRKMNADMGENRYIYGYNADMIQLQDGAVLLTGDFRITQDSTHDDETGALLPVRLRGTQPSVVRSTDGGLTWSDRSPIVLFGGEAHLLELASGKLLAASRYQRNHPLPGDPAVPIEHKKSNGYRPQFPSEESRSENSPMTNRVKNIYLSESLDGGRTWVDERRVTSFLQCPGDLVQLPDGTLVLIFLHRYPDDVAHTGIRAIVSDDSGATWRDGTYILSQGHGEDIDSGSSYPGSIAMPDGTIITVCGNFAGGRLRLEAVHWRIDK